MMAALVLLLFVSVLLAGWAISAGMSAGEDAKLTLRRRLETMTGAWEATSGPCLLRDERLSSITLLNKVLVRLSRVAPRLSLVAPVVRMIRRAGLKRRAGEIFLSMPLVGFTAFLLITLLTGNRLLGMVAALPAASLPLVVVRRIRRRRALEFAEQLPEALELMGAALHAGHGLISAMAVVAEEFPDPIAHEFREVTEEIRLGLPLRDALAHLAERVDNPDIPILQVGVLVAQTVGGALAEVLENIAYTIRERFKIQREMQVLTAQGRLSGGVLTALPFFAGFSMLMLSPDYFLPLLESRTGHYMLAYAAVSLLVGHLIIRGLVRIKV
jgi:tight adherence protein B